MRQVMGLGFWEDCDEGAGEKAVLPEYLLGKRDEATNLPNLHSHGIKNSSVCVPLVDQAENRVRRTGNEEKEGMEAVARSETQRVGEKRGTM